jgi:hypothetical protein
MIMAVILTVLKQFMMNRRIIVNGQEKLKKGTSMSNCVVLENALTLESLEGQVTRTLILNAVSKKSVVTEPSHMKDQTR